MCKADVPEVTPGCLCPICTLAERHASGFLGGQASSPVEAALLIEEIVVQLCLTLASLGTWFSLRIFSVNPKIAIISRGDRLGTSTILDRFFIFFNLFELLICRVHVKIRGPAGH